MNIDDFCYVPPKDLRFKRRVGFGLTNDILTQNQGKNRERIKMRGTTAKNDKSDGMKFVAVGHSVINNVQTSNASHSSISSQANTQK